MNVLANELERRFEEVFPMDFYREIFPSGELDDWRDDPSDRTENGYTGIIVEVTKEKRKTDGKTIVKRHTVTDDLDAIDKVIWGKNFCIMAPISYIGKSRISSNARIMYALVVELDDLVVGKGGTQDGLRDLLFQCKNKKLPTPTFIVASGNGLHLYYQFEKGIPMFPNIVKGMEKYKRRLTTMIWNRYTTNSYKPEKVQQESIFQGFRMVGTVTKRGDRVRAFRTGEPVTLEYMFEFVQPQYRFEATYRSGLTRTEAQKKYPDWYERRVVRGEGKKHWVCDRAVYDWWKRQIMSGASVGHRYYCMMCLCIYAIKCEIPYEELEADCLELLDDFDAMTEKEENHFTLKDVFDALQSYNDKGLVTYPVTSISNRSGIAIEKNKRNYRKQSDHLKMARFIRDEINGRAENWREGNGRPDKEAVVAEWRVLNPGGTKYRCMKETGLSKMTVYKWWDSSF